MIERIIENWLDNASEKSFKIPFTYMLQSQGYKIIHISRDSQIEFGKDIIAIAPDGKPCGYQLKRAEKGRFRKRELESCWNQLLTLTTTKLKHPSLDESLPHHRSIFVVNGELEEEAQRLILDYNDQCKSKSREEEKLETFTRSEMLKAANDLGASLFPSELVDVKVLLEIFLNEGNDFFPKEKLFTLLESALCLKDDSKVPSEKSHPQLITSSALITVLALANFTNKNNHFAEIEAWTVYLASILSFKEKYKVKDSDFIPSFDIAMKLIYNCLENLFHELKDKKHYVEGDTLAESYFYRQRLTLLMSLLSILGLWRKFEGNDNDNEINKFLNSFIENNVCNFALWGEAAIPQFLSIYWYWRTFNATKNTVDILENVLETFINCNSQHSNNPIKNPYHQLNSLYFEDLNPLGYSVKERFEGFAFTLESLFHIFIRDNRKNTVKGLWKDYSHITLRMFIPATASDFFKWRTENGKHIIQHQKPKQNWDDVKKLAFESEGKEIPDSIKEHPILLLLFLVIYPHRLTSNIARWLDTKIDRGG